MPNKTKHLVIVSIMAAIMMAATSCQQLSQNAYSVFMRPATERWMPDQWLDFNIGRSLSEAGADTIGPYDVLLTVRHTDAFPGQTLWLAVETTDPHGAITTDTIPVRLASASGRWRGRGTHSLYTLTDTLARSISPLSSYAISVAHASLPDSLPGIYDIGITLIRTQNTPLR